MDVVAIQKRIDLLEKYQEEVRNAKDMLQGELDNSLEYTQLVEEIEVLAQKKKLIKNEVFAEGPNQKLVADIKGNMEEISTLKEILTAELIQVYKESDSDEFNDANGDKRKFKIAVRLLPKRGFFQ